MGRKPLCVDRDGAKGLGLTIWEVSKGWRMAIDESLKPLGLSSATWSVIFELAASCAPRTQKELAAAVGVEGPTLVRLLDRLEQGGWVERQPVPGDRRLKQVVLTDKAEPYVEELVRVAEGVRDQLLRDIPEEDLRKAHEVMLRVRDRLGRIDPEQLPRLTLEPCCRGRARK